MLSERWPGGGTVPGGGQRGAEGCRWPFPPGWEDTRLGAVMDFHPLDCFLEEELEEPVDLMFSLDQEMEEQEHLTKAVLVVCQERGHPDTFILEGRDEIGTARSQWERSSLEKSLGATQDLLLPCPLSSLCVAHVA